MSAILCLVIAAFSIPSAVASPGKLVLLDKAHDNTILYLHESGVSNPLSMAVSYLTTKGYTVTDFTTGPITLATLRNYDVYWINAPLASFTAAEINDILQFVLEGHGLFLTGEWGGYWTGYGNGRGAKNLNDISTTFGIKFNSDVVVDPTNYQASTWWVIIHQLDAHHQVTSGKSTLQIFAGCSFDLSSPAYGLAWGDADTYIGDTWPDPVFVGYDAPEPTTNHPYPNGPLLVAAPYGIGRVVAHPDVNAFDRVDIDGDGTASLYDEDNELLLLQIMDWLGPYLQQVIPEVPFGTVIALVSMVVATVGFVGFKRFRPKF